MTNEEYEKLKKPYGGSLQTTREGRAIPRPLTTRHSMHLVLRSTKARGALSFTKPKNKKTIEAIVQKFSRKYSITIITMAIVGNHMHLQLKLKYKEHYNAFIRATTAAIAMAITKASRINPMKEKFWDRRPFSRVAIGIKAFHRLKNYIAINQLEGCGNTRAEARFIIDWRKAQEEDWATLRRAGVSNADFVP